MGVITIKVPQQIKKNYEIASKSKARRLLESLEGIGTSEKLRDLSGVTGLWADRSESAEVIARELRRGSNQRRNS